MSDLENLEDFVADALEVVEFKLIRSKEDIEDESIKFHPVMAHQIFGDNENIFGYKDLKVNIMYTAGPLQIYIGIKYSSKIEDYHIEHKADDILNILTTKLPSGCFFLNIDEFVQTLEKGKDFKPLGEKLTEYITEDSDGKTRHFEIYQSDYNTPKFLLFFSRLQTFILWFVDAACYIDIDDPQWMYFVCYEKYKDNDGNYQYATIGYSTIYKYYAYPEHIRPRISQMLILPPFQKLGIGSKLMETIYKFFQNDENITDITVEDPSEEFQKIRNFIDSKLCKDLPVFSKENIKNGFCKEMAQQAKQNFKINEKQCRKIYEILRLYYIDLNNKKEYKEFRLEIKKRLSLLYFKQIKDIERLNKDGYEAVYNALLATLPSRTERIEKLEREYGEIEKDYLSVIEKLRNID